MLGHRAVGRESRRESCPPVLSTRSLLSIRLCLWAPVLPGHSDAPQLAQVFVQLRVFLLSSELRRALPLYLPTSFLSVTLSRHPIHYLARERHREKPGERVDEDEWSTYYIRIHTSYVSKILCIGCGGSKILRKLELCYHVANYESCKLRIY